MKINFLEKVTSTISAYSPKEPVKSISFSDSLDEAVIILINGEYYKATESKKSLVWKKSWRAREVKKIF